MALLCDRIVVMDSDRNAYHVAWRQANLEDRRKYEAEWYERNKERARESGRRYRAKYPERQKERNRKYKASRQRYAKANPAVMAKTTLKLALKKLGMTLDDHAKILVEQQGACKICLTIPDPSHRKFGRLRLDHDHATGKFRGLLCDTCNRMIGFAKDDVTILQRAITYLS